MRDVHSLIRLVYVFSIEYMHGLINTRIRVRTTVLHA